MATGTHGAAGGWVLGARLGAMPWGTTGTRCNIAGHHECWMHCRGAPWVLGAMPWGNTSAGCSAMEHHGCWVRGQARCHRVPAARAQAVSAPRGSIPTTPLAPAAPRGAQGRDTLGRLGCACARPPPRAHSPAYVCTPPATHTPHAHSPACMCTDPAMRTPPCAPTPGCVCTHPHACCWYGSMRNPPPSCARIHKEASTHAHVHIYAHTRTHPLVCTCASVCTHAHACTRAPTEMHTHLPRSTCTRTCMSILPCPCAHTPHMQRTHACLPLRVYVFAHVCTHSVHRYAHTRCFP